MPSSFWNFVEPNTPNPPPFKVGDILLEIGWEESMHRYCVVGVKYENHAWKIKIHSIQDSSDMSMWFHANKFALDPRHAPRPREKSGFASFVSSKGL